jgi:hypothetical protein
VRRALPETRLVGQLHRVEDGADGDADRAQLRHRLVLRALARPTGDDRVFILRDRASALPGSDSSATSPLGQVRNAVSLKPVQPRHIERPLPESAGKSVPNKAVER